jgi:hypothetical protein
MAVFPLLRHHVRALDQPSSQLIFDVEIGRSLLDRAPLIGGAWAAVRRAAHRIPVYYVRKVVVFLLPFHRQVANALQLLVRRQDATEQELADLRRRLADLEARIAEREP